MLPLPGGFGGDDGTAHSLGVLQLTVAPGSGLVGAVSIIEDRFDVRVLRHLDARGAVKRAWRANHHREPLLAAGDIVLLLGPMNMLDDAPE